MKEVMESSFPEMAEQEAWQQKWGEETAIPQRESCREEGKCSELGLPVPNLGSALSAGSEHQALW